MEPAIACYENFTEVMYAQCWPGISKILKYHSWHLVCHTVGGTKKEGVKKGGAEEDIWA